MLDLTKPVQTRDGRKARIIATDLKGEPYKVVAAVLEPNGVEVVETFTLDGVFHVGHRDSKNDLINAIETQVIYANVYKGSMDTSEEFYTYSSLDAANMGCINSFNRIGVLKVSVTGNKITAEQVA